MIEGKYKIEINFVGDGRIFLNRWDSVHGNDVVAELKNGKLYQDSKEITFQKFVDMVKESVLKSLNDY